MNNPNSSAVEKVIIHSDPNGVGYLTINRPLQRNAFDSETLRLLHQGLNRYSVDDGVRVVVINSTGDHFSAGADISWMKTAQSFSREENIADAEMLSSLLVTLDTFSKPTIALVKGSVFGGAIGILACCDIVLAAEDAVFSFSEVRLGLIPATISPYVVRTIGAKRARRYFLTAERFNAVTARELHLVDEVMASKLLESKCDAIVENLLKNAPGAMSAAKDLIALVAYHGIDESVVAETTKRIADTRVGAEAQEGLSAFLEKRPASWVCE